MVYTGRSEEQIGDLIEQFEAAEERVSRCALRRHR